MAQDTQANAEKSGNGMKKNILLRTNLLICVVIIAGFLMTAVLSYRANYSASLENIEQVSTLTSEGIYYQMNSAFTKPVNISLTMANDSLLKEFLATEAEHLANKEYQATAQYFEKMGAPKGTPYDQALQSVGERQIHEAYREGMGGGKGCGAVPRSLPAASCWK